MSVEKNVPEIRFKGFSGDWEAREFGSDLVSVQTGTNLLAVTGNSGFPLIKMGNIQRGYFSFEKVERLSSSVEVEKENIANYGDFLFNTRNTLELVGKGATWMGNSNEFAFNNNIARFTLKEIDTIFFNYLYNTQQMIKQVQARAMGTTSVAAIYPQNLKSIRYALPKIKEQTQIGSYFQKLDSLINQHQQKHDKLSNIKKAMLEKMFPKQGETIPEIRFKGFSGEWEVRSWRDTVDISTNMVDPRSSQYGELFHVGPGNIESFTGMFYNNVLKVKDSNLISGKFHFNKGDIIYGKINPQLAKYVIAPFEGLASADAYVLSAKNGVVQNYLYAILQTEDFYKYTVSVSSRTGMPKINRDELNIYSYLSPDEAEQERIGNYFQKLDALINQHQQQITKLNNIKQACLSKMFV